MIAISVKFFLEIEAEEVLNIHKGGCHFARAQNENVIRKRNYRPGSLMSTDMENFRKKLANCVQQDKNKRFS